MAKDRARPFSKKHRRYWLPVTGGMLLICAINVGIGMCAYDRGPEHTQRMDLVLPPPSPPTRPKDALGLGEVPVEVIRAFNQSYPQRAPQSAKKIDDGAGGAIIEIYFLDKRVRRVARFHPDGTLIPP